MRTAAIFLVGLMVSTTAAIANETVTYSYDALGRLVVTSRSSGPSNGVTTSTAYDRADNRTTYIVTGSNRPPLVRRVVVLPFGGRALIPLSDQ